jgi:hypothetical protein
MLCLRAAILIGTIGVSLNACNVAAPPQATGGVDFVEQANCERGLVVVMSDYKSSNVALTKLDGAPLSSSLVSSAAAKPGLALALSGDVVVPHVAPSSGRVVLLDRFGTNVVTWMDPGSAEVIGQLPVGTGFESNPHDYIEFGGHLALVSRFGSNPRPGLEAYDAGGDLLVIDTESRQITGRIALPEEDAALLPRPGSMRPFGDSVVVTLGRLSADFDAVGSGRFVGVSLTTQSVVWTVDIEGLKSCGRLAISPSGRLGAIACSGQFDRTSNRPNPLESDIVLYDVTVTPPRELRRLGLGPTLDAGLQPTVEFASETKLVTLVYGGGASVGGRAVALDLTAAVASGATVDVTADGSPAVIQSLFETSSPYALGDVHCAPGCGDICVIGDADSGQLRRYHLTSNGEFTALDAVTVDERIGLPPRAIGAL